MRLNGALRIKGQFIIEQFRKGKLIDRSVITNTTTNDGFAEVAGLINGDASGAFTYLALDNSSTAATAADTTLASEITTAGLGRAAATCSRVTTTQTSDTAQLVKTFTATATITVRGAGVFDAAAAGNLLARSTFSAKNLETNDTLQITYKVKVS